MVRAYVIFVLEILVIGFIFLNLFECNRNLREVNKNLIDLNITMKLVISGSLPTSLVEEASVDKFYGMFNGDARFMILNVGDGLFCHISPDNITNGYRIGRRRQLKGILSECLEHGDEVYEFDSSAELLNWVICNE